MSREADSVFGAIDRWERAGLIDGQLAGDLRVEVSGQATESTRNLAQYVLAVTGAAVLILAGGVFLEWAWPLMGIETRTALLAGMGVGVIVGGVSMESGERWRPAAYLMQTAGLVLLLVAFVYGKGAWQDQTLGGVLSGVVALVLPIVLAPRAMKRNVVMPAVHLAMSLAFLAVFLDRATGMSGESIVWILDGVLLVSIAGLIHLLLGDPDGERHPWALNAFVAALGAGFVLVGWTAFEVLSMSDDALLALDAWLALTAGLTLWGMHRAPAGLRRAWFGRFLAQLMFVWIVLGSLTVSATFNGEPELALLLVGGVGVLGFIHGDRHGIDALMGAGALAFIVPVWWWAVERGGALGGVAALLGTAALLFWASGRRGKRGGVPSPDESTP